MGAWVVVWRVGVGGGVLGDHGGCWCVGGVVGVLEVRRWLLMVGWHVRSCTVMYGHVRDMYGTCTGLYGHVGILRIHGNLIP